MDLINDATQSKGTDLSAEERFEIINQLVYRDGELVYQGTTHNNEYVDDAEKVKYLYQIFSEL